MSKETSALYAGTFDPLTNGHLDIIRRAHKLFDRVIVAVSENPKKNPLFSIEERVSLIHKSLAELNNVSVVSFNYLLTDLAKEKEVTTMIKGIRAVSDFEFELQMALANRRLAPEIETIYLLPSEEHTFISSRIIKEVSSFGGDVSSMVPLEVKKALQEKFFGEKQ